MAPKLTDEQVIQVFENCFVKYTKSCDDCPAFKDGKCTTSCEWITTELPKRILDFINRLKADNERLTNRCDDCAGCTQWKCDCSNIKTEAYQEFAERLIIAIDERISDSIKEQNPHLFVIKTLIKDIEKEMVGEG